MAKGGREGGSVGAALMKRAIADGEKYQKQLQLKNHQLEQRQRAKESCKTCKVACQPTTDREED